VARDDVTASQASTLDLHDTLLAATKGRGAASVSVISSLGTAPNTSWVQTSDEEPAFLAYSITKIFTAALILTFCEDGRLTLDDRLARWFPKIADADRISLRRLLNHTAGIPDYGGVHAYHESVRESPSTPWSFERYAAETFEKGLLFAPGQGWEYSNAGYMLVKRILEEVGGATYRDLISERIARRLGLERTFVAESIGDLAATRIRRRLARWGSVDRVTDLASWLIRTRRGVALPDIMVAAHATARARSTRLTSEVFPSARWAPSRRNSAPRAWSLACSIIPA